ncbi:MAG: hypothetical protein AAF770_04040, partial [Bacteroidota bacterium]
YSIFLAQYTDSQIQENQLITNQSSFVKHTNPLKLANASTGHFPVVVSLPNGQIVAAWNNFQQDKESSGIYFQLFDVVSNKTVNDTYTYTPTERIFPSYDFPTILPTSFRTFFSRDEWIITIDSRIFWGMAIFIGISTCMDCLPFLNSHYQSYINKGKKRERREEIIASMLAYDEKQSLTNNPLIQKEALQRLTQAIEDYYFYHVPVDDDVSIADIIGDNSYDQFPEQRV